MSTALVLGAGGTVGIAYHLGALRALEAVGGVAPDDADLVIGTSAGSLVGALVRSGWSTDDLYVGGLGERDDLRLGDVESGPTWAQAWRSPYEFARRAVGSAYVLQRSLVRVPVPRTPQPLRRFFPGGFFTITDGPEQLDDVLPHTWPSRPLWLIAVDVRTGRRVLLGRRNPPRADLHDAVLASCAIPGFFQPVRAAGRTLVDGGVHSPTNLDLAGKVRPSVAIVIAPMGYEPADPPGPVSRIVRDATQQRPLQREAASLRRRNVRLLQIRPGAAELRSFGPNMMRPHGNEDVTRIAFEATSAALDTPRARDVLAQFRDAVGVG